jgi:hypothetical protein
MTRKLFLTDVDGVLLNWHSAFCAFIFAKGYKTRSPEPLVWSLEEWIDAPKEVVLALVKEFNSSHLFEKIEPYQDALAVLPLLAKEGYEFVAITSCSSDEKIVSLRKKNLECFNVPFKEVHCLDLGQSKADLLKFYPEAIWVEDNFNAAVIGASFNHETFLLKRSYNKHEQSDKIKFVDSWFDIKKSINNK